MDTATRPPRSGKPWTAEEEATLRRQYAGPSSVARVARYTGRSPDAVVARLIKMGVISEEQGVLALAAQAARAEDALHDSTARDTSARALCGNISPQGLACIYDVGHGGVVHYAREGHPAYGVTWPKKPERTYEDALRDLAARESARPGLVGQYDPASPYEPIKVIEHYNLNFSLGCVIKYVLRAGRKPGVSDIEDLEKARQNITFEIERRKRLAARAG